MKTLLNFTVLLLLLFTITATSGQNAPAEPRRTAAEQAAFEKSVPLNPAKVTAVKQADSRVDPTLVQAAPVNWKPALTPADDRKTPEPVLASHNNSLNNQPAPDLKRTQSTGLQPGEKTANMRDLKGPKIQPVPPKEGKVVNYREINGPRTQPEGDKPAHK